ncbi:uncharacterized protein LOC126381636 [Pectinophora gossypiella]|uniref:uncharacterized protein LOC126381636 n=1 Tax=Pectinophora gossypiella TaxID=13191 RepID=UPI00214E9CC4|nr:uncharacterized protein LOC126381636 [Pectinophora gossypiella]
MQAFSEYETSNIKMLSLDKNANLESDITEVENKYYSILTIINNEISRRERDSNQQASSPSCKLKLPAIDVPVFSGKFTDYTPFINLFNSLIDSNKSIDFVQKLYYLRSYLKDEALDLIKNLPLTADSYNKAITLLDNRYNNKFRIVNEHITTILDMKPVTKSTASNLREFVATVRQELAALSNLEPNTQYWDAILLCVLSRKLYLFTSRAYQLERDTQQDPTMDDFLAFLTKRALAMENAEPGIGQQRLQQPRDPREQYRGPAGRAVVTNATAQPPACLYCPAADVGVAGASELPVGATA